MSIPSFPPRSEDTLKSDSAGIPGSSEISNIVTLTQAAYNALAVKDSNTLYIISG